MKYWIVAALVSLAVPAIAMDARHPDWPCPQIVVPKLSVAAFWTGPSIDDVGDAWMKDQTVQDLVLRLAGRRTFLAEAEKEAAEFIVGTEVERQQKAKLLFAGLFATLGRERDDVMTGIERFSQRQQQLREKISAELTDMRAQQDAANQEPAAADKLSEQIAWDTRIFDERRHTISYVCEVPSTIERRLFALARAIQQKLD
jgi:DNA polymerase III alpha subunit